MELLLLTLTAHVVSDFVLQSDLIAESKSKLEKRGYIIHISTVFLCTYLLTHFYGLIVFLLYSIIIAAIHFIIDIAKNLISNCIQAIHKKDKFFIEYPYDKKYLSLLGFISDQIIHFIVILYIWVIFNPLIDTKILQYYKLLLPTNEILELFASRVLKMVDITAALLMVLMYLGVAFGGAILTRKILDCFDIKTDKNDNEIKVGKYIGILERIIILTLFLYGSLSSIAFVLTAKSVARFQELDNKEFAEYYLLGTFVSTAIAILTGIILVKLIEILPQLNII